MGPKRNAASSVGKGKEGVSRRNRDGIRADFVRTSPTDATRPPRRFSNSLKLRNIAEVVAHIGTPEQGKKYLFIDLGAGVGGDTFKHTIVAQRFLTAEDRLLLLRLHAGGAERRDAIDVLKGRPDSTGKRKLLSAPVFVRYIDRIQKSLQQVQVRSREILASSTPVRDDSSSSYGEWTAPYAPVDGWATTLGTEESVISAISVVDPAFSTNVAIFAHLSLQNTMTIDLLRLWIDLIRKSKHADVTVHIGMVTVTDVEVSSHGLTRKRVDDETVRTEYEDGSVAVTDFIWKDSDLANIGFVKVVDDGGISLSREEALLDDLILRRNHPDQVDDNNLVLISLFGSWTLSIR